ncbi:hypothetical protein FRC07_009082 [Ceratobasidium sp. 392]|nr:hypothetical protein FRC07_009082 [Ceratobasidium sp. 392]
MKTWQNPCFTSLLVLLPVLFPDANASIKCGPNFKAYPDLYEASIRELQVGLDSSDFTSVDLVTVGLACMPETLGHEAYLKRIEEVNLNGAKLQAVVETNRHALEQAVALDVERRTKGKRSPLHGIPILVKDNISTLTAEGMNTTAGSYALLGSVVPDDAFVVTKLREAGAIILGKTNLSQWSYIRDWTLPSGWSSRGGQATNPYFPGADPCGSSSGSAVSTAVGLAAGALGTDTAGSVGLPLEPEEVIPVSLHQDTIGPIARNVADAAAILSAIAGQDSKDNYTGTSPDPVPNYTRSLDPGAIKGKRFGIPRQALVGDSITNYPSIDVEFNKSLEIIRSLGGIVVDPVNLPSADEIPHILTNSEMLVFQVDLKVDLNQYLKTLKHIPTNANTLEDIIAFNNAHKDLERPKGHTGQSILVGSQATNGYNSTFYSALEYHHNVSRTRGIDAALEAHDLDALVVPSSGLSMLVASLAGYPMITVPLGFFPDDTPPTRDSHLVFPAPGIPFGLGFMAHPHSAEKARISVSDPKNTAL